MITICQFKCIDVLNEMPLAFRMEVRGEFLGFMQGRTDSIEAFEPI